MNTIVEIVEIGVHHCQVAKGRVKLLKLGHSYVCLKINCNVARGILNVFFVCLSVESLDQSSSPYGYLSIGSSLSEAERVNSQSLVNGSGIVSFAA